MARMRIPRAIVALLLALSWLPAALHCGLEDAGVLAVAEACCSHDDASQESKTACGLASCAEIESGRYQVNTADVKLAPPAWLPDFAPPLLVTLLLLEDERNTEIRAIEAPPELLPTWQFVRRAAPPSRAPSIRT